MRRNTPLDSYREYFFQFRGGPAIFWVHEVVPGLVARIWGLRWPWPRLAAIIFIFYVQHSGVSLLVLVYVDVI